MSRLFICIAITLFASGCSGPSSEELRRMQLLQAQRAAEAARQEQQEAERRQHRIEQRRIAAKTALSHSQYLTQPQINQIFSATAAQDLSPAHTYYQTYELQPAKYNYGKNKQSFLLVGMRNLPDSSAYSPLFPDESALYQPGQKAKSVLEFILQQETKLNRLGKKVLKPGGKRWVAAVLNFKNNNTLASNQSEWFWEQGLFEDVSWKVAPEISYPLTVNRDLMIQLGFRFCFLQDRCYLTPNNHTNPTQTVRAEILSALIVNKKTGDILVEFINDAP